MTENAVVCILRFAANYKDPEYSCRKVSVDLSRLMLLSDCFVCSVRVVKERFRFALSALSLESFSGTAKTEVKGHTRLLFVLCKRDTCFNKSYKLCDSKWLNRRQQNPLTMAVWCDNNNIPSERDYLCSCVMEKIKKHTRQSVTMQQKRVRNEGALLRVSLVSLTSETSGTRWHPHWFMP